MIDDDGTRPLLRDRLIFAGLIVLLCWISIPLGSNREWSSGLMQAWIFILFSVWLVSNRRELFDTNWPHGTRAIVSLGALVLIWVAIQTAPLPHLLVELLNPGLYEAYTNSPSLASKDRWLPLSADIASTAASWKLFCAYGALFVLTLGLVNNPRRLTIVLGTIVAVGVAQCLYGIVVRFGGTDLGLWDPGFSSNAVAGTYVNRNHFAGLMVLAIGLLLGRFIGRSARGPKSLRVRDVLDWLSHNLLGTGVWFTFALIVLLGGLILSTSRGALAAFIVAFVMTSILVRQGRGLGHGAAAVGVLCALAVLWFGSGDSIQSLSTKGLESNRPELAKMTWQLIQQAPLVGGGAGTYQWRFPQVRDEGLLDMYYDHAHNDYLETWADVGAIGFVPLLCAAFLLMRRLLHGARNRNQLGAATASAGCFAACTAALTHALVDFNFQIPANAAYFFVIAAAGLAAADRSVMRHQ